MSTKKNIKEIMSKRYIQIGILIVLMSLVGLASTYAWFTWKSSSNTNVTLSIGNLADVTFTSGPDINISNLAPVYNYTDGVSTTFTVRNTNSTDSLLYKVKLEITSIANELKDESFKYTLLKDNKVIKTGNLKDAVNGNPLILNTSSLDKGSTSSPKTSTFKLYFWLDGNMENNSNMMNKSLVGKIDVGVETNVLTNAESSISSTSKFLNTEVPRQNIKTLKYVDNLNIPEGATVVDVSKSGDNTIKMWYNEADANGNYDITIGSNNIIYANPSSSGLFSNLTNVTSIDLSNLDTSGMTSMKGMFSGNTSLTDIIFGDNFDTSNVTIMNGVFRNCNSLASTDLSSFNTSSVTDMNYMFAECSNLTTLDLSNFDTSNTTSFQHMFDNCSNLTTLNLSNFDTSNVTHMNYMFYKCSKLTNLDLSSFNTSNVIEMGTMFGDCTSLKTLNLSNFDTSSVISFRETFYNCSSLESLDLSNFNTSSATNMSKMFAGCKNIKDLNLSSFNTSKVTNLEYMFHGCRSLISLNLSGFDTSNVTNMRGTFMYYGGESLDLSSFNTSKVTTTEGMISYSKIRNIDLSNADFSSLTNHREMFYSVNVKIKDTTSNRALMNNFPKCNTTFIK